MACDRRARAYPDPRGAVMELATVLARLYASEINVSVTAFWDAGWDVRLGDSLNGFRAETTVLDIGDAAVWLDTQARLLWPDSVYAREAAAPNTLSEQFDAWCEREIVSLTATQRAAAHALLKGVALNMPGGRGSGKTFVLEAVRDFLDDEHPRFQGEGALA